MQSEAIWIPELRLVQRQWQLGQSASRIPLFAIGCRLPPLKRLQKTQTRNQPACGFGFYLVNSIMSRYLACVHVHTNRTAHHPSHCGGVFDVWICICHSTGRFTNPPSQLSCVCLIPISAGRHVCPQRLMSVAKHGMVLFGVQVASNPVQSWQNRDLPILASRGSGDSIQLCLTRTLERDDAEWTGYGICCVRRRHNFCRCVMRSLNNFRHAHDAT